MHIQNPVRKRGHKLRRDDPHIPREADEIDVVRPQLRDHRGVMLGPACSSGGNSNREKPHLPRNRKPRSVFLVREHHRDLSVFDDFKPDRVRNRKKVRTTAGEENTYFFHFSSRLTSDASCAASRRLGLLDR
jgi:hypothetical protein